jgi:uncharacterized protein (TIGR03546 family)
MFVELKATAWKSGRALLASSGPGQLAAGFTLGMVIGVLPKGNLIALLLCVLLFVSRCNKGVGLVAAVVFSFVGVWTDPFAHRVGLIALNFKPLESIYAAVFNLPFGPWFAFNNTVVVGALLIGIYLAYPVYWITRQLFSAAVRPPAEAAT